MPSEYTPTMDEIRLAWWMHVDNPADNEGASDVSFERAIAAHDAVVRRDEREKCAQIADGRIHPNTSPCPVCDAVAAIRAQSEEADR